MVWARMGNKQQNLNAHLEGNFDWMGWAGMGYNGMGWHGLRQDRMARRGMAWHGMVWHTIGWATNNEARDIGGGIGLAGLANMAWDRMDNKKQRVNVNWGWMGMGLGWDKMGWRGMGRRAVAWWGQLDTELEFRGRYGLGWA
eukprot:630899-Lingulodinium_polyedra.AAC.1